MDSFRFWGLCTGIVFLLSLTVGSYLLILVWVLVSVEIAVVLWTPLRAWLGIPESSAQAPRARRGELVEHDLDLELVDQALEPVEP